VASETSALATAELRHPRDPLRRRLNDEQQRSLADLYRSNASAVYFVCQFLLRNPEDAADATQEVFLKAVESLRHRSTPEDARSWLLTAAQNHCLDLLRRYHRVERISTNTGTDSGGASDPETLLVERDLITAVFGELRARERRALWLWAVERRPLAQIARDLGLSYTAVQQLLFRARRHAASVAARVAALLGLLQLGRALRRASQAYQVVLVAAVVPVVLATVPSSTVEIPYPNPPPQLGREIRAPALLSPRGGGTMAPVGGRVINVNSVPVSLPPVPLKVEASAVDRAISTLDRKVQQLTGQLGLAPNPTPPSLVP
jgi:RNA polymerase sigma-70 factor (ECF subfamily)